MSQPLQQSIVDHYRQQGWASASGFFSAAEILQIDAFTDEVIALPEVAGAQMVYREPSVLDPKLRIIQRIEDFCPWHLGFDRLIRGGRLQMAVEQLTGSAARLFKEKINLKLAGGGAFEPHQDQQAGWSAYAPIFVTAMVSIDPASTENGCLEIAAGPRRLCLIGREWEPLNVEEMADLEFAPVPTQPGDVIFFDSFVPHSSKENRSAMQRRILYLTYNKASDGDFRTRYYAAKRASFPPDIDRLPGVEYRFRV